MSRNKPQKYTYNGITQTLPEWSRSLNIAAHTLRARIKLHGWDIEKAFATPIGAREKHFISRMITYEGKTQNIQKWARETDIHRRTLSKRIFVHGWSIEKALTTKVKWNESLKDVELIQVYSVPANFTCNFLSAFEVWCGNENGNENSENLGVVYQFRRSYWRHTKNWESWRSRHEAVVDLISKATEKAREIK